MMKRIFMLLAVVLLTSASAMAQSGNNSPLKGDVNSDGSVDVADIVAVIDLIQKGQGTGEAGYFYLGTTKPTAENFTTLAGAVATYTSIDEAVGTKVSVAAGETLYMLCPTSWMKTKDVALEDDGGETVNFSNKDAATISGYSIYETSAWKASSTATLKIIPSYFWYCGKSYKDNENTTKIDVKDSLIYIPNISAETLVVDFDGETYSTKEGWRQIDTNANYVYDPSDPNGRNGYCAIYVDGLDENGNELPYSLRTEVTYYVLLPTNLKLTIADGLGNKKTKISTANISNIQYDIYRFYGTKFLLKIY